MPQNSALGCLGEIVLVPAIQQSVRFEFGMPRFGEISYNGLGKGLGPHDSSLWES